MIILLLNSYLTQFLSHSSHSYIMIDRTGIRVSEFQVLEIQITPHMVNKHHKIEVRLYHKLWKCNRKFYVFRTDHIVYLKIPYLYDHNFHLKILRLIAHTLQNTKYYRPNLSNCTFKDFYWPYFTFEHCFINHVKDSSSIFPYTKPKDSVSSWSYFSPQDSVSSWAYLTQIVCLIGHNSHRKTLCLTDHNWLLNFNLTNDFHIHQLKCRATAGNGLYTSDTIVEAPVRYNTLLNLAQSVSIW